MLYLAALHKIGLTHKLLHQIFKEKNNYKEVFENINYNFLKKLNLTEKQIENILKNYEKINLKNISDTLEKLKVKIITFNDKNYPESLKHISNPPFLLYIRGKLDNNPKIAIVWTRKISTYWEKVIENFTPDLSKYFTIVSGWAAGCDTKAHKETLKNNWKTIAVIGTGIDRNYPISNKKLYDEIFQVWAIISIFPLGEVWNPYNFPIRNEIIVGLSLWVVVVEAAIKSGSLITANLALDYWKDLFAIPGEIIKINSSWTNKLIASGEAKMVLKVNDILEEYNIQFNKKQKKKNIIFSDNIEESIYNLLLKNEANIEQISKNLDLDISTLLIKISFLEINGFIWKNNNGIYYIK